MTRFKKLVVNLIVIAMIFAQCSTVSFAAAKKPTATAKLSIVKGKKATIKVNAKGTAITSKSFKSNKTKIAKVNKKTGKVTAVKVGSCKITATVKYRKTKKAKVQTVKLTTKITVTKAQAAPTPTPDDSDDYEEEDPDDDIEYPEQDPNDVTVLTQLAKAQKSLGAEVDDDPDSAQYTWGDKGRLESIDWSECKLSGKLALTGLTGLTNLKCAKNDLTSLDVSKNTALTDLECHGNSFTTLDISKNKVLEYLSCDADVKVTGKPASLNITYEDTHDRKDMAALKEIIKAQQKLNPDTSIDTDMDGSQYSWSDEGRLEEIDWSSCDLTSSISLTPFAKLTGVACEGNTITSLDVSNCTLLTTLTCSENKLKTLKVDNDKALEELHCQENELTELVLTGCSALETLECQENKLTKLTISACKNLAALDCHSNQLKTLSISGNTLLAELDCSENNITSLTLNKELNESDAVTCDEGVKIGGGHYSTKEDGHTVDDCSINFIAKK